MALGLLALLTGCGGTAVQNSRAVIPGPSGSFPPGTILSGAQGQPVSFDRLIEDLSSVQIVYIGETHTDPAHHEVQLKILKALHMRHPELAVGMEMFARSYQDVLQKWYSDRIDEKELLQKTHWKANWSHNFALYRPLLHFVREQQIPLYGLNISFHIPPKIAAGGLCSLNECEQAEIPAHLDFSRTDHRKYVAEIFGKHVHVHGAYDFDNFYAAQVVWDEVMAETISRRMDNRFFVALTGNGHIIDKFGIPQRCWRRNHAPYRTVMPVSIGTSVAPSAADYIWLTPEPPVDGPKPHRHP